MRGRLRKSRAAVKLLVVVALVGGCGGEAPALSTTAAEELHAKVAAVREAAGDGDRTAALRALDELGARVRKLEDGGSLAAADASALRRGIAGARRRVREEVAAPAATATATPSPTATAPPEATTEPEPPGKAKGKGKPKGKGKAKPGKGKP